MPSKYGLGAFAIKNMKAGEYIGEYTGEHLTGPAAEAIDPLQKYSNLNYAFGVYDDILDSWHAGNETRYLNDSKPDMPNCNARLMIVDFAPRIVIETLTNVAAGEELTLGYGDDYWINKIQKEPEQSSEKETGGNHEEISDRSDMSE
ncbi:Histone-lysine N-methyltransferase MEDEA [Psilocybe cubensis]|uniref:Histone-lysine N-methyltransferase MEDEA n=1 Tax=Psilocybe cubensis TaxID=181762 RepID=A0ACB8GPL3_PSICU|nr:Histone-lysine N-methyltransferase MEDEA [Psilocybe cubensis]KAH9477312.1 Histone-lysine N-methyltransferase MEDEA [Psilocybe cubensis]